MADTKTTPATPAATFSTTSPLRTAQVEVDETPVSRQVTGPAHVFPDTTPVHEVRVTMDTVIKDTSDPLAVQVPAADINGALTPLGRVWSGKPEHVEAIFARESAAAKTSS